MVYYHRNYAPRSSPMDLCSTLFTFGPMLHALHLWTYAPRSSPMDLCSTLFTYGPMLCSLDIWTHACSILYARRSCPFYLYFTIMTLVIKSALQNFEPMLHAQDLIMDPCSALMALDLCSTIKTYGQMIYALVFRPMLHLALFVFMTCHS